MKTTLDKWQFVFSAGRDYRTFDRGWKQVAFGFFKLHHLPLEGERLHKGHYKGFFLTFYVWVPIET